MSPEHWQRVAPLLDSALELPPTEWDAFLMRACSGDDVLRAELAHLLAECAAPDPALAALLARPAAERFAALLTHEGATLLPQSLAPRFRVAGELGRGGMATVLLAHDLKHGRDVAIKVLRPDLGAMLGAARFLAEIRVTAKLRHPHILALFDSGEADDTLYYVTQYVAGGSLRDRLRREERLPTAEALRITRQIAEALDHAHAQGVVHRDIKPENVLLEDGGHVLVADFGIARAVHGATGDPADQRLAAALTTPGFVVGTPAYMSPEQAVGAADVDGSSDQYGLACVAFELLAGEPAFRGSTADIAAQRLAPPVSLLAERRPELPRAVTAALRRALAFNPGDRFPTAVAFAEALASEADPTSPRQPRARASATPLVTRVQAWLTRSRRRSLVIAAGIAAIATVAYTRLPRPVRAPPDAAPDARPDLILDTHRVVVFPLSTSASGPAEESGRDAGVDVARLIGYRLEGTDPLRWGDGADDLDAPQRRDMELVSAATRRTISRRRRAAYFIDGSVLHHGDSATVILRLHSVAGDSVVAVRGAAGRLRETPVTTLGLRAAGALLVPLLEPGRRVDGSALLDRTPASIALFLQGESEYRASHFARALEFYRAALAADSLLALAALKGAQAATWLEEHEGAELLARVALARTDLLPPHRAAFARGLHSYLTGAADSAVADFRRVLAYDALHWSEPWMALGEVYRHLLPNATRLDSVAEDAFERARRIDPEFTPPLYHLAELAFGRGAFPRADTLVGEYNRAHPDSAFYRPLDLMLDCVRRRRSAQDWTQVAAADPGAALQAGVLVSGNVAQAGCSRTMLWAALNSPAASEDLRWSALLALQSLLVATGRDSAVGRLLQSPTVAAVGAEKVLLLDGSAGAAVQHRAEKIAGALGRKYAAMSPYTLWLLGNWEAHQGRRAPLDAILRALMVKADSSRSRSDSLMMRAVAARAAVLAGDTARAIRDLRALTPSAPRSELAWYPWEALAGERLLLARLLLAQGDHAGAQRVASRLEGFQPVVNLVYRRPGLEVLIQAAAGGGDTGAAARYRAQLAQLAPDTVRLPWEAPLMTVR